MEVLRNCNIYCTFQGCFCMMYWSYFISSRACPAWLYRMETFFRPVAWPNEKCGGLMTRRKRKKKLMRIHFFSGQISIIPKPELRGFWGSSLIKPPFRVTSADLVIICPDWWGSIFLILHIQIYQASLNLLPNLTIFTIIPNNRNKNKQLCICSTWKVFPRHLAIIFFEPFASSEQWKKTSYFPLYWLINRDPYNGLWNNPHVTG